MNVNKKDLAYLKAMLEDYKQSNGPVSITAGESTNCSYSCAGYCSGTCNNFCTYSCRGKCDGSSSFCWRLK